MINGEKVGVGIVTGFREELYKKCLVSIPDALIDKIVIVNDNPETTWDKWWPDHVLIENKTNLGVGKSKNKALDHLYAIGCEHIFLIEEDIFVKDPDVFEMYINASKVSGIQHFNYSQHGRMNKTPSGEPNPKINIGYGSQVVSLYPHCVGAFSYYSRKCLDTVGFLDEEYYNACEHVDHTYEIIKAGMHPPFWYFADIDNSWDYLGDEEWSIEKSTISSNPNHQKMMQEADRIFVKKHGHYPGQTPLVDYDEVGKKLKEIRTTYGSNYSNV